MKTYDVLDHAVDIIENKKTDLMYVFLTLRVFKPILLHLYNQPEVKWLEDPVYQLYAKLQTYKDILLNASQAEYARKEKSFTTSDKLVPFLMDELNISHRFTVPDELKPILKKKVEELSASIQAKPTSPINKREATLDHIPSLKSKNSEVMKLALELGLDVAGY